MPDQTQSSFSTETTSTNGNVEPRFKKLLYNEVTLVIAVIGITVGVFNYINNPQQQIQSAFDKYQALQEQRDTTITKELQVIREGDLKDLKADILENRNQVDKLTNAITKLETIIQERIPAKK